MCVRVCVCLRGRRSQGEREYRLQNLRLCQRLLSSVYCKNGLEKKEEGEEEKVLQPAPRVATTFPACKADVISLVL